MKRSAIVAAVAILLIAIAVALIAVNRCGPRRSATPAARSGDPAETALARLRGIPLYRTWLGAEALRSAAVDDDGTLHVEVDLRAVVEPRLAAVGLPGASDLLPATARGTIAIDTAAATPDASLRESWSFEGPAALFDLLDRNPAVRLQTPARDAIPGSPSALLCARLMPSRLADPSLGGTALASWRDRARFAEKLLGRPLRAEIAEDLAGPAVFALYETPDGAEAEAILAVELRRSDRLAGLVDMLLSLGALTERATVGRYRGVPTGSFVSQSGGPGLALAVDGPVLVITTSRARLESAIDARRAGPRRGGIAPAPGGPDASWSAESSSVFVAHGWARLARSADPPKLPLVTMSAELRPEGTSGWRLTGHGPAPAVTADPMLPYLRSVFGGRQREGG